MKIDENLNRDKSPKKSFKAMKEFMGDVLMNHQEDFERIFDTLKEENPRRWVELYIDMMKHVIPKQSSVNVNVGINKDYRELLLMANTVSKPKELQGKEYDALAQLPDLSEADFDDMEELTK